MPHQANGHAPSGQQQTMTNGGTSNGSVGTNTNYRLVGTNGHTVPVTVASTVTTGGTSGQPPKVNPADPQVRKLVYNMYRGMLANKHDKSTAFVETVPQHTVMLDEGIGDRLQSMLLSDTRRQQSELKEGNMSAGGPPPPPPPPPLPGVIPGARLPSEIPRHLPQKAPPMALAGAMMKDKKPFTYTPGGIDLSEINTQYRPQQNGSVAPNAPTTNGTSNPNAPTSAPNNPVQSRAFRVLQNVLDTNDTADTPIQGAPMKIEVPLGSPNYIRRGSSQINGKNQSENSIIRVIPIVQADTDSRVISTNEKQQSNIFKNQVKVSSDVVDDARSRGGHIPQINMNSQKSTEPQGPVHLPNLRNKVSQQPHLQQPLHQQPISAPIGSQLGGANPAGPSEQQNVPEPKKYMGGAIPSRSFKMLQQMTGSNDVAGPGQTDL